MGKAQSGKTSMRSIIFTNNTAHNTERLSPTLDVEHHHVQFLGNLSLNLWDCGGQDAFYESYFERDRESIFSQVEVLIYVFDITSKDPEKDLDQFSNVLDAILKNSSDSRVFVLIHKMDMIQSEDLEFVFGQRSQAISNLFQDAGGVDFKIFATSIWDETLYKAWSDIVTSLIPNIAMLSRHLKTFCRICDADEVVLFERRTFLIITHSQGYGEEDIRELNVEQTERDELHGNNPVEASDAITSSIYGAADDVLTTGIDGALSAGGENGNSATPVRDRIDTAISSKKFTAQHFDAHRFEKISNIVKQFKLSCNKADSQFSGIEICNSKFTVFIESFTENTYIMVIVSNRNVHKATTLLNVRNARKHFERFFPRN